MTSSGVKNNVFRAPDPKKLGGRKKSTLRTAAEVAFRLFGFLEYAFYPSNNALQTSRYEIDSPKIPRAFDGLSIVQVSDLHGKEFGKENVRLLDAVAKEKPAFVAVTGDLVDDRHFNLEKTSAFIERLARIAPVYYVVGNHEADLFDEYFDRVVDAVVDAGAIALLGIETRVRLGDDSIVVAGVRNPAFDVPFEEFAAPQLRSFSQNPRDFRVLLTHRPDPFAFYARYGYDLVFSGHAHGGQFRIPFLCPEGLNAPNQGWFPRYASGLRVLGATRMIISRGLGPSVIPTRLFNRPELVVCKLRRVE